MNLNRFILIIVFFLFAYSCADYNINKKSTYIEKKYFSSRGFALVYDENLYLNKTLNRRLNNEEIAVMHSLLKTNTPINLFITGNYIFFLSIL